MQLLIMVIIIQMVVIIWLAWPRMKPKAIDYWAKAKQIEADRKRTTEEEWIYQFNIAQGVRPAVAEAPRADKSQHAIVSVKRDNKYEVESLKWQCSCGSKGEDFSPDGMKYSFKNHVELVKEAEKWGN